MAIRRPAVGKVKTQYPAGNRFSGVNEGEEDDAFSGGDIVVQGGVGVLYIACHLFTLLRLHGFVLPHIMACHIPALAVCLFGRAPGYLGA